MPQEERTQTEMTSLRYDGCIMLYYQYILFVRVLEAWLPAMRSCAKRSVFICGFLVITYVIRKLCERTQTL